MSERRAKRGVVHFMTKQLSVGDRVSWAHAQGRSEGRVIKVLTEDCTIESFRVSASPDDPRYLVESDKTGARAAHKAEALRKS